MEATIIFPHQLFERHPAIKAAVPVFLVEADLFFTQYNFHKKKLLLHRASMKAFAHYLEQQGTAVTYIDCANVLSDIRTLIMHLAETGITRLHCVRVADNWLEQRITKSSSSVSLSVTWYPSPGFFTTPAEDYPGISGRSVYYHRDFYIARRKQQQLLLDPSGGPVGGKWSFDAENRKRMPAGEKVALPVKLKASRWVIEATEYVSAHFADNYGDAGNFNYPVTFKDAKLWLDDFLEQRLADFGKYEDAIRIKDHYLYHSVLTPCLNTGLLTPAEVIAKTIEAAGKNQVPLNSLEGFIRQVTGWREFMYLVYEKKGSLQRSRNFWNFSRKIPPSFWSATTGIEPIDAIVRKLLLTGYAHHIERLMILGNFMLLCEFDPDEVYRWFMELFIDSYDWVMVPNVYGMSQFADGGMMTTKPYISGSNYLKKMGDFPKGEWQDIWDALFWRFMEVHRDFFQRNPRLGLLLKTLDRMPAEKRSNLMNTAENFLSGLDRQNSLSKK